MESAEAVVLVIGFEEFFFFLGSGDILIKKEKPRKVERGFLRFAPSTVAKDERQRQRKGRRGIRKRESRFTNCGVSHVRLWRELGPVYPDSLSRQY